MFEFRGSQMCGIAGFMEFGASAYSQAVLRAMTDSLMHRGPDSSGYWWDEGSGVGLGHRRLSILDLSACGHQPMQSLSGRYAIIFNGEIYNHLDLRTQIGVRGWRGHSDTETLVAAIETWGVEEALKRLTGMFAFALWDAHASILTLARDRLGEKPLYYGWQRKDGHAAFLFGSELKSLRAHPAFEGEINRDSLCLQLRHNCIPAPYSIYKGIHKLQPGHLLQIKWRPHLQGDLPQSRPYWSLEQAIEAGRAQPFVGSDNDAISALDTLLRDSICRQMTADVPLGAFLSGGIDSSTVVALMQVQSTRAVKTFTIGFSEGGYNEAEHAKAVAHHLGTDHTELYVAPQQALDVIPRLPELYDEPFSDSSQIPTFLVSQLAKRQVTVSLSGDAGDELFGGYNRYFGTHRWWGRVQSLPRPARRLAAAMMLGTPTGVWDLIGKSLAGVSGDDDRWMTLSNRIPKLAEVLRSKSGMALYRQLVSHWLEPSRLVIGGTEPATSVSNPPFESINLVERMMALDAVSYLPDDILVKVDRAAMGVSLETRVPFLDHRVVEFAWRLPLSMKIRDGQGKWILRQVLYQYVPKELIDRPKMGFGVPIDRWLRGPLRDWSESLLGEVRLRREGYFDAKLVRQTWDEHLSGRNNWQYLLWDVLMFQLWLEHITALNRNE